MTTWVIPFHINLGSPGNLKFTLQLSPSHKTAYACSSTSLDLALRRRDKLGKYTHNGRAGTADRKCLKTPGLKKKQ